MNDKKVEPDRYRIFKADNDDKKKNLIYQPIG